MYTTHCNILHNIIIFLPVFLSPHFVRFIWPIQRLCTSIIVDGNATGDFQPLVSVELWLYHVWVWVIHWDKWCSFFGQNHWQFYTVLLHCTHYTTDSSGIIPPWLLWQRLTHTDFQRDPQLVGATACFPQLSSQHPKSSLTLWLFNIAMV